jgi:anti-sigma factor RsiW
MDAGPGYALDILDPAQRSQLEFHLGDCPNCRARVEQMSRSAAALLDLTGTSEQPDPGRRQPAPVDPQPIATRPIRRETTSRHDGHPVEPQRSDSERTDGPGTPDQERARRPVRGRGRRRLRTATTLAVAAALMVGTTFGPEIASGAHHGGPVPSATGVLMSAGRQVGEVIFYSVAP